MDKRSTNLALDFLFHTTLRKTGCSDVFPYYKLTDLTGNRKQNKENLKEPGVRLLYLTAVNVFFKDH